MPQLVREKRQRTVIREINADRAADAIGPISPGCEMFGLYKGQFSLIELIEHALDYTGPAGVVISTWTAGNADISHFAYLVEDNRIRSCRWLLDASFPQRQPDYCRQLTEAFGVDSMRFTANHAKFVLLKNKTWNLCIRTSMNLNQNRRLETYEISDDPQMMAFLVEVARDAWESGSTLEQTLENSDRADKSVNVIGGKVKTDPRKRITSGKHPLVKRGVKPGG